MSEQIDYEEHLRKLADHLEGLDSSSLDALALRHLLSQREELKAALAFYADQKSWEVVGHSQIDADTMPAKRDQGRRARATLEECK